MAKARKVIITCAVTGSIHTPSMSPQPTEETVLTGPASLLAALA